MLGISLRDRIRNEEMKRTKVIGIVEETAKIKWRWARLFKDRWAYKMTE